jgi:hypothetical protein
VVKLINKQPRAKYPPPILYIGIGVLLLTLLINKTDSLRKKYLKSKSEAILKEP